MHRNILTVSPHSPVRFPYPSRFCNRSRLSWRNATSGQTITYYTTDFISNDPLHPNKPLPVLVDFWAPGCGPCNSIEPVVEKLADAYSDQFRFACCNVDHSSQTPDKYGIKGIPTLMFFKAGKLVDKLTGLMPMSTIEDAIKDCLSEPEPAEPVIA